MEVKDQEFVYPAEVLEMLQGREEEDLSHEQKIALEKLSRHTEIEDIDTLSELHSELGEIEGLKERHIYKVLDVFPRHESTVRAIFSKERVKLEDSDVEDILEVIRSVEVETEDE